MSARTIALQLRTLAADPDSQALLLQESSCLSGLVALLHADNEEDVLILSLQALAFLAAAGPANHAALVNQPGLVLALSVLTEKPAVVLKTLAQNVLAALEGYINGGAAGAAAGATAATPSSARGRTPIAGTSRTGSRGNTRPTTPSAGGRRESGSGSLGTLGSAAHAFVPRYLNHVVFHITASGTGGAGAALDKAVQIDVEKALVAIKGVVSVTYSATGAGSAAAAGSAAKSMPTFTLYTSIRPANLGPLVVRAVGELRAGLVATMVTKDKGAAPEADKENQDNAHAAPATPASGAPSYLNKGASGAPAYLKSAKPAATAAAPAPATAAATSSGSGSAPGYLNASASSGGGAAAPAGSRALAAHSTASSASDSASGLAARYQSGLAKKKADAAAAAAQPAAKKGGLLSSVTSYFW